jgi:hypothetical protein
MKMTGKKDPETFGQPETVSDLDWRELAEESLTGKRVLPPEKSRAKEKRVARGCTPKQKAVG